MIHGISYSDDNMNKSLELCVRSMGKNGVEKLTGYGPNWIGEDFSYFNKDILTQRRGCGYWLWKPYIIYDAILKCKDGDILIYSDAGVEWLQPVNEIISRMDEDIFFFTNGFPQVEWCKGDVLAEINPMQFPIIYYTEDKQKGRFIIEGNDLLKFKQVQASVIFFKVNQKTRDFVKKWLLYCQMPGFIDDSPSKLPNYPTFAEHRHDQAILTCLQIKYGFKLHFWSTPYSEHIRHTARPEDNYPTMFNHHRRRNPGMGNGDAEWPQT